MCRRCLYLFFCFILVIPPIYGREDRFFDVHLDPNYQEALLENRLLMNGSVDVITTSKDGEVLVGVASVLVRDTPAGLSNARIVASAKARALVAKFLEVDVSVVNTLKKQSIEKISKTGDGSIDRHKRVVKLLETWIEEKAFMSRRTKEIGWWQDRDGMLYCAVCIFNDEETSRN